MYLHHNTMPKSLGVHVTFNQLKINCTLMKSNYKVTKQAKGVVPYQDKRQCIVRSKRPGACANGDEHSQLLTGTTKQQFSHIHRSVSFYPNITKFAVRLQLRGDWIPKLKQIMPCLSKLRVTKVSVLFSMYVCNMVSVFVLGPGPTGCNIPE